MLETRDLTLHYGGSQILNGVSVSAAKGQVTCVMGYSNWRRPTTSLMKASAGNASALGVVLEVTLERAGRWGGVLLATAGSHELGVVLSSSQGADVILLSLLTCARDTFETGLGLLLAAAVVDIGAVSS